VATCRESGQCISFSERCFALDLFVLRPDAAAT
jgi:hypothetical protein